MKGILGGMARTLQHIVRPRPVTRKYPYEKRELPERSRGLIALLLEPETSVFKCESCLLCEKACPPRCISISYRSRHGFRKRPLIAPRASYYRIRMVGAAPYGARRPLSEAVRTVPAEEEEGLDLEPARRIIAEAPAGEDRLNRIVIAIHEAYGYLPWTVVEQLLAVGRGSLTDIYTAASILPSFRGAPAGKGTAVPRGGRKYTGDLGIAGVWPQQTPPPAHDRLREDEAHHPTEPAYAR